MRRAAPRHHNIGLRVLPVLMIMFSCAAVFAALPGSALAVTIDAQEQAVVAEINKHRKAKGLKPVAIDVKLTKAADWMSKDMATKNYFSHTDSAGNSPFDRIAKYGYPQNTYRGENLAAGNAGSRDTFIQWKNSPGHNENMLHSEYRAVGVSRVYDASSTYGYYWTTTFGSTLSEGLASKPTAGSTTPAGKFTAIRAKYTSKQRRKIKKSSRSCKRLKNRKKRFSKQRYKKKFRAKKCGKHLKLGKKLGYI